MAPDPRFIEQSLRQMATEQGAARLGAAVDQVEIDGTIIRVRSGQRQVVFRAQFSQSCSPDRIPCAGGLGWRIDEVEVKTLPANRVATWTRWFASKFR